MKWLALIAAVVPVTSFCSFDLLLIPEPTTGRIHRYDPVNQVSLGYINTGSGFVPYTMTARSANTVGKTRSSALGSTMDINWSTGERGDTTNFFFENLRLNQDGSNLYEAGSSQLYRYNSTGTMLGNIGVPAGSTILNFGVTRTNHIVALVKNAANDLLVYNYSPTLALISNYTVAAGGASSITNASHLVHGNYGGNSFEMFITRSSSGTHVMNVLTADANGLALANSITYALGGYASACIPELVEGHNGTAWALGLNSAGTGTTIFELEGRGYNHGSHDLIGVMPRSSGFWSASNIVAPEPGSMIALGLGAAALLRKRRR